MENQTLVYKVSEVAELLSCSRHTVYDLINSGQLRAVKIGSLRVTRKDLLNYIESLEEVKEIV